MKYFSTLILFFSIYTNPVKEKLTANEIINRSITNSGAFKIANSKITFKFRDKDYAAIRKDGNFKLFRDYIKDSISIDEVLTNDGYKRLVNGQDSKVTDSMVSKYSNAINSVHYFSVLPYGLNDKAVRKRILPSSTIKGEKYYKIEITFSEDGGGEDFEDVFIYWIGKEDFLVDYLAYSYHTNGGGKRFRVLKEQCNINGIRFVDYHNYKPLSKSISLINIDKAFENNELKKVSEIILEDIKVELLK
jgi:hypothetical protein